MLKIANLRSTTTSRNGKIFIIEHVVTGPNEPHFAKLFDIHMMCWGTGPEKTEDESCWASRGCGMEVSPGLEYGSNFTDNRNRRGSRG